MPIAQIEPPTQTSFRVELYWLPLGAGDNTHCVRANGRIFEAVAARAQHRHRRDLYHSALEVRLGVERYVIEMAPVWSPDNPAHGGVCEGPVGMRGLGRSRLFRYEVRRWRDGVIPDASAAVDGPISVKTDPARAARLVELVPLFPTATWGRDELATGDMWNSNSLVSWLLASSGHDTSTIVPPAHGRAPGWASGLVVAARQSASERAIPVAGINSFAPPRRSPTPCSINSCTKGSVPDDPS